ncbi:hypothetical protein DL768_010929 [Monosporascus sp. mg162]|nr:hypothetical protein DL768_010929 [Monosporascus sp. mg162]
MESQSNNPQKDNTFVLQDDSFSELRETSLKRERLFQEAERLKKQVKKLTDIAAAERQQRAIAERDQQALEEELRRASNISELYKQRSERFEKLLTKSLGSDPSSGPSARPAKPTNRSNSSFQTVVRSPEHTEKPLKPESKDKGKGKETKSPSFPANPTDPTDQWYNLAGIGPRVRTLSPLPIRTATPPPPPSSSLSSDSSSNGGNKRGGGGGGNSSSSFSSSSSSSFSLSSEDSDSNSDSDSSDSSDDDNRKKRRKKHDKNEKDKKKRKEKKSKKKKDSNLRWKRFDFSLDKENHLKGLENWELWKNALDLALEEISSVLRKTDYTIYRLIDDFNSEFHYCVRKPKGESNNNDKPKGQSYNAKGRNNNNGNNNNKGKNNNSDKPLWNAKGEPLCWNCGKYGHLAKDCRKPKKDGNDQRSDQRNNGRNGNNGRSNNNGNNSNNSNNAQQRQSKAHFIPDGLEDLYNQPPKKYQAGYSAAVDQSEMREIMKLFDRTMKQKSAPKGVTTPKGVTAKGFAPKGALNPKGQSTIEDVTLQECHDRALGTNANKPNNAHLRIIGSCCTVLIDENYRIKAEKLELLEGGRFLVTPYVRVYEEIGEKDEPPDPKDVTDDETKAVKRKRGRPKKIKPELYKCEVPDEDFEIIKALIQEGADPYPGVHNFDFANDSEDDFFYGVPDD